MCPLKIHLEDLEADSPNALAHALLFPPDMLLRSPYHSALPVQMISQAFAGKWVAHWDGDFPGGLRLAARPSYSFPSFLKSE